MKRLLLTLAVIAAFIVPASAYAPQNNLFLDLTGGRVYHHGTFLMLEELRDMVASQAEPVDNVIVTVDEKSEVVMMLGIRDYVAEVSSAQVIFIFLAKSSYTGEVRIVGNKVFTLDRSPFFEPLSNQEYYTEQALWEFNQPMPEETRGITVLMDNLHKFYMGGTEVHYSAPFYALKDFKLPEPEAEENGNTEEKPEENAGDKDASENAETDENAEYDVNEIEVPYFRVKLTADTTVEDLLAYEHTITWYCVEDHVEMNYAYFTPDTRVAVASAFNINPATLDDLDIATVNFSKPEEYSVAAKYYDYSDLDDIITQIGYYIPSQVGHNRGRAVVWFTVGIDGSVKDIVQESGLPGPGRLITQALETAPPFWSQALDNDGNPVNMRFRIKMRIQ